LHETSARWVCNIADIAGWAEIGKFRILTGIAPIRCGDEIVSGKVVLMADLAQLTAWRDALMAARYQGIRTVEYDGKRVTYATDVEMAAALGDGRARGDQQAGHADVFRPVGWQPV